MEDYTGSLLDSTRTRKLYDNSQSIENISTSGLLEKSLEKSRIQTQLNLEEQTDSKLDFTLTDLLHVLIKHDASDLHIKTDSPPMVRIHGDLLPVGEYKLTQSDCAGLIFSVCTRSQIEMLVKGREIDIAYSEGGSRFRINAYLQKSSLSASIRMLRTKIPDFNELNLPGKLEELVSYRHGLVLVTGPAGTGKSTTLAAMVNYINTNSKKHIITIEDPIEYIHTSKKSLVTQREVGSDTLGFHEALKHALRQDPDVLLIGEMRDPTTIFIAAQAAETGHLVLSTLHTPNTVQAVSRILDVFTGENQKQMRLLLASNLRGVVSQRLIVRSDIEGRVPAVEILIVTPTIASLILEEKINDIYQFMQQGRSEGMQTLNQSLYFLHEKGLISYEDAIYNSDQATELRMMMEGHTSKSYAIGEDDTLISWI